MTVADNPAPSFDEFSREDDPLSSEDVNFPELPAESVDEQVTMVRQ